MDKLVGSLTPVSRLCQDPPSQAVASPAVSCPSAMPIKHENVIAAANRLLSALGLPARFIRYGIAREFEPDLIYRVEGRTIGLEVTPASDDDEAAREWPLARKSPRPHAGRTTRERLQETMNRKSATRSPGLDAVWLCVEQKAGPADLQETRTRAALFAIPTNHPFERIYLASFAPLGEGGGYHVFEISGAG